MYCDRSLAMLVEPTAKAELLSCKLLYSDKKENVIFLIHKEIQKVIYEEGLPSI
jgi:hypothetical protein